MTVKGQIVKNGFKALDYFNGKSRSFESRVKQQKSILKDLLKTARKTEFGKAYSFDQILNAKDISGQFKNNIPTFNYETMYSCWWNKTIKGRRNVSWPGKINYLALTSGTSLGATKKIPVSKEMISSIRKTGFKHLCSIVDCDLPTSFFDKDILALGGSIMLERFAAVEEGDLSGILTANLPQWLSNTYLPGNEIAKTKDWSIKVKQIVEKAPSWDVGIIAGVPSWVLLLIQEITTHYNLDSIHDIWPNFRVYAHGGVFVDPYKTSLDKYLKHPIIYTETYLASEGYFAYQSGLDKKMMLASNDNIYYEFLPFNNQNFDNKGNVIKYADTVSIEGIEEELEYALLISTCSGAWRYLIGDVVKFTNKDKLELEITGRTKHFVNLCGEHLSVDNLNDSINFANSQLSINIQEFSIFSEKREDGIFHNWIVGLDEFKEPNKIKTSIDERLKENNADYRSVRKSAIKDLDVYVVPNKLIYAWMSSRNKSGGQHKVARVLTKELFTDFLSFISVNNFEECKKLY